MSLTSSLLGGSSGTGGGGGGGGEANTGSNVNAAGVGVFKAKSGVTLQFRGINAGSNKVTVTNDSANNEIDIDVVPSNIDHGSLQNVGTNSHATIDTHLANTSNPHATTKAQVGLGNVANSLQLIASNNLSDLTSVSTAKTNLSLTKTDVGLSNVENTALSTWVGLMHPGMVSGAYYWGGICDNSNGTGALTANTIYYIPIFLPSCTITKMGVNVTVAAAAGKLLRYGIYSNSNGAPSSLLLDAGTIAADATGLREITGLSSALGPGWYWLALISDGTPTVTVSSVGTRLLCFNNASPSGSTATGVLSQSFTFGSLPASPTSPTLYSGSFPRVWVRL